MRDIAKELRDKIGMQVGDWPALIHEAANEIERLRAMVQAAALTCEQCGKPANIADQDDWTFCGVECMEAMKEGQGEAQSDSDGQR